MVVVFVVVVVGGGRGRGGGGGVLWRNPEEMLLDHAFQALANTWKRPF